MLQVWVLYSLSEPHGEPKDTDAMPPPRRPGPLARLGTMTRNLASTAVAGGQAALRGARGRGRAGKQAVEALVFYGPPKPHPGTYTSGHGRATTGHLEGTLWTIPVSAWPRDKLVPLHPPQSEGPGAISHKWVQHCAMPCRMQTQPSSISLTRFISRNLHRWHARISNGILTLAPIGEDAASRLKVT